MKERTNAKEDILPVVWFLVSVLYALKVDFVFDIKNKDVVGLLVAVFFVSFAQFR